MGYDLKDLFNDIGDIFDLADWGRRIDKFLDDNPEAGKFVKFVLKVLEFYKPEWVKLLSELVNKAELEAAAFDLKTGGEKFQWVIDQLPDHWLADHMAEIRTIIELLHQILPETLGKKAAEAKG